LKTCVNCNTEKDNAEFHKNSKAKDGLYSWCKICAAARGKEYKEKNKEKHAAQSKAWRENNRAHRQKMMLAWRTKNKDTILLYEAEYRKNNPEKRRAAVASWQKRNPLQRRVNESIRRARIKGNGGAFTVGDIKRMELEQDWLCNHCNADISNGYHIDHKMPVARGGSSSPQNLQLLCQTCNESKGARYG
jgi:5-methylcytosine-specific restriction endonuclease McrA